MNGVMYKDMLHPKIHLKNLLINNKQLSLCHIRKVSPKKYLIVALQQNTRKGNKVD